MLQAIKIKLYPSEDQKIYINKLLGTSRFVYNQCLNYAAINIKNEGLKKLNLELQQVNSSLGMSLPEVTLTECNGLPPRRSKKQIVKSYDLI